MKIFGIDLAGEEIKNWLWHKVAGDPGSPATAQAWYDTVANRFKVRVSGTTKTLAHLDEVSAGMTFDSPGSSAVGDTVNAGVDTDAARADHRHGREAFAAPTASTAFGASSATGTSANVPHADHDHGTPAHNAAAHSAISLSALAVPTADLAFGGFKGTGAANGVADSDLATVGQLNSLVTGLNWKEEVRAATTAAGTLATSFENGDTVDGVVLATGDRVLIKNQAAGAENRIAVVAASGAPARSADADTAAKLKGAAVVVTEGTVNGDTAWYLGTDAITVDTTALVFSPFPGGGAITASAPVTKTGNDIGWTAASALGTAGPGGGLTSAGAIDKAIVSRGFAATIGDNAASSFNVDHNLGTQDVVVSVRNTSTNEIEHPTCSPTTTNRVVVNFAATVPATGGYRVTVLAIGG